MSSENIHITRHNYEEYFLLYVDNELSAAERMAVEAFVSSHPDLREELDILLQTTVLEASHTSIGDKSFLMADSMKVNAMDDSLLLYLDNELKGQEKRKVEEILRSNSDYQLQYNLLLRTKLQAEKISYPNKAELYRRTERATGGYWLRVAAAIIVIAAITLVYFLNADNTTVPPAVADVQPKTEQQTQPDKDQVAVVPAEEKTVPVEVRKKSRNKDLPVPVRHQAIPEENNEQVAYSPVETQADPVRIINTEPEIRTSTEVAGTGNSTQQIINTTTVTDRINTPYNSGKDLATIGNSWPEENEKGSSVKGLLRKATRFIEKRTGVNPVNEDDELLIGVVSIKLK
jgi:hypothetical protein